MTFQIGLLIALTCASAVFFSFSWISPDVTALGLVLALVFTGLLPAQDAFQGFGSDTVIMIMGLLILTASLMRTGVMDLASGFILRWTGTRPMRLLILIMVSSAFLGAFMSNTASTAFFVPVVMGLAKKAGLSPRQLLLPLAFSSILTSSVTLISTSTNIVVSGLMQRSGLQRMGMFEMAPVGLPIAVIGIIYMIIVGRFWLTRSARHGGKNEGPPASLRAYLSEVIILPESPLVGKTLAESRFGEEFDLTIVRIVRGKADYLAPRGDLLIQPGDVLLAEGTPEDLLKIKDKEGIEIKADLKHGDPLLPEADLGVVEAIILPRSTLIGRTLKSLGVRERYGVQVLGISRHGEVIHRKISQVVLRIGDILLVQGARPQIAALANEGAFRVVETLDEKQPKRKRAPVAIAIFVASLALGSLGLMPMYVAVILGSVASFLTRCITPDEAYRELEWKAVILIGSMLALGTAMEKTGTARYLAGLLTTLHSGPMFLLAGFFFLTVLLTQPMSNQAAAVVLLPVAIETANRLGLNPRTFAMMVAVAASCSYLTPLEPSCLMVYGPGGYKFSDFLKIGSILTLIIAALALWLVPIVWPLSK